jgi:hypothetical protein
LPDRPPDVSARRGIFRARRPTSATTTATSASAGIDSTKLHFARKRFGQIFMRKFVTLFVPKAAYKNNFKIVDDNPVF